MEEQEKLAAAGQPEGELLPEETGAGATAEAHPAEPEVEPEAAGEPEPEQPEPDAEELSAEQLLGEQSQPAPEVDSQAADLKAVLEAIVYVLNEPMPVAQIAQALDRPIEEVEPVLRQLAEETNQADRGIFIREVAGGYQMATKPEHHEVLRSFVKNLKQPLKLSQAALETLAVIAYKQPITMPEILEIRGVQGGGVVKTLIDRKLITTAGRKNVIGKPMLYKTTKDFLTQFGLRDLNELPSLKEFEEISRQSIADEEFEGPGAPETPAEPEAAEQEQTSAEIVREILADESSPETQPDTPPEPTSDPTSEPTSEPAAEPAPDPAPPENTNG